MSVQAQLEVILLREDDMFVAYSPALDLSTCGETFEEARKNFVEALDIFMKECIKGGTLDEVLESLGWKKVDARWQPPTIVGKVEIPMPVPG